jgi:ribosomal protein S18 acetylase RimI-like enzyme
MIFDRGTAAADREVRIGVAEPRDWPVVRAVRLAALSDTPLAFGSTHARESSLTEAEWLLRFTRCTWFLARRGDSTVGVAACLRSDDQPFSAELASMWVRADHRGTGIATELVAAVQRTAASGGAAALGLWVAEQNERARRFYHRLGFRPTGRRGPLPSHPEIVEVELEMSIRADERIGPSTRETSG